MLDYSLLDKIILEEKRGIAKWGSVDRDPTILLNAAMEELGEVAHGINHDEGSDKIQQEIAQTMAILSRLYTMVNQRFKGNANTERAKGEEKPVP